MRAQGRARPPRSGFVMAVELPGVPEVVPKDVTRGAEGDEGIGVGHREVDRERGVFSTYNSLQGLKTA